MGAGIGGKVTSKVKGKKGRTLVNVTGQVRSSELAQMKSEIHKVVKKFKDRKKKHDAAKRKAAKK